MVMPRSRSMSILSRYCARICRASTTPVSCSIRSASVDLPWSMWAMMQKFRMIAGSVVGTTHRTDGVAGGGRAALRRGGASTARLLSWSPNACDPCGLRHSPWDRLQHASRAGQHPSTPPDQDRGRRSVANIKSQIKRIKTNEKARLRNKSVKSSLKTAVRKYREAAAAGDAAAATTLMRDAGRALDKAASKGVIHANQAANRKSAMAKQTATLAG
jgi:small subunit ribosomal protein S20